MPDPPVTTVAEAQGSYDWKRVAALDNSCQRLAIRYEEARPGSAERFMCARWVGVLQHEMDRYIATHSAADGLDPH